MKTEEIFEKLESYRKFPTYQLERRLDAFMFPYLEDGISNILKIKEGKLKLIYPEFPIKRLSSIHSKTGAKQYRLSEYADFLMYLETTNTIYLVEFKTDVKSIHEKQFETYYKNCEAGWGKLLEYYFDKINTRNWRKFVHGLIHLHDKAPDLFWRITDLDLEQFLKNSQGVHDYLGNLKKQISSHEWKKPEIKFIYLAPFEAKGTLEKYVKKHPKSKKYYKGLVSLNQFACAVNDKQVKGFLRGIDPAPND